MHTICKKIIILFLSFYSFWSLAQQNVKHNWVLQNPFEQKVFIENNEGQFDGKSGNDSNKVIFSSNIDGLTLFFTTSGVIFRHDEAPPITAEQSEAMEKEGKEQYTAKPVPHFFSCKWKDANTRTEIIAEEEASFYYTYPVGTKHTIIAHAFKKIRYQNLYSGIDVEYFFPEDKKGIEYTLIVHPGADLSKVKLLYSNAKSITQNAKGDIEIESDFGTFIDHNPQKTWYKEDGKSTSSSFYLKGNEVVFSANNYNKSKTLVIDPWVTNPTFTNYNVAYDLRYDLHGNVYAYGNCAGSCELIKLNSAGTIQWLYNTSFYYGLGDFTVDEQSGSIYIGHAFNDLYKISPLGVRITYLAGNSEDEVWRVYFDNCNHQIIIGGGGTGPVWQGGIVDTNLTAFNMVNFLGATLPTHDIAMLAVDEQNGYCYTATAHSLIIDPPNFDNVLTKCPLISLYPYLFSVSDGYSFQEISSVSYIESSTDYTNGFNGMAVSPNWLYLYDGAKLKRFDKNSGSLTKSLQVSNTSFAWGGLDVNNCDNIYVGNNSTIMEYDSTFAQLGSISAPGQIYDLRLGHNNLLYACGKGFVAAYTVDDPPVSISVKGSPACSGCTGTAYVTLNNCNASSATYLWSDGQTGEAAMGLCGGTYAVTATIDCIPYQGTITIDASPNPAVEIPSSTINQISCIGEDNGSATAIASGGTPPFSYTWLPSGATSQTLDDMGPGINYVIVKDVNGCSAVTSVDMTSKDYDLFVPNAFSPNGDGQNDKLFVRDNCIKSMDFLIFDRWGNKLFESENQNEGWDGTYKGQPMNSDTYVYVLKATMFDKSVVEKKGTVALVR
jgi:gliding motility-associated-like protein